MLLGIILNDNDDDGDSFSHGSLAPFENLLTLNTLREARIIPCPLAVAGKVLKARNGPFQCPSEQIGVCFSEFEIVDRNHDAPSLLCHLGAENSLSGSGAM